jgi:hypothetical protein
MQTAFLAVGMLLEGVQCIASRSSLQYFPLLCWEVWLGWSSTTLAVQTQHYKLSTTTSALQDQAATLQLLSS